jgi:hypothetical protein
MVHRSFGFFMNWTGTQKGEGFEYHLLALAVTAFLITGAGVSHETTDRVKEVELACATNPAGLPITAVSDI